MTALRRTSTIPHWYFMSKDWFEWHNLYAVAPVLQQRLQIVREFIAQVFSNSPPGLIRLVSVCAGDGRDLLSTLAEHPRARNVFGRLVELNLPLVEQGRAQIEALRLGRQIEFLHGDATDSTSYAGAVPADVVLLCGVLGNLPDEEVLVRLIKNLAFLARKGAHVIWTRGHFDGIDFSQIVRKHFAEAGYEEIQFRLTATGNMGIGLHRFFGETRLLPQKERLFVFSGSPARFQPQSPL